MESVCGEVGLKELAKEGTNVEIIEEEYTRLKKNMDVQLKKRFDKNHVVKNVGKQLYALHNSKSVSARLLFPMFRNVLGMLWQKMQVIKIN